MMGHKNLDTNNLDDFDLLMPDYWTFIHTVRRKEQIVSEGFLLPIFFYEQMAFHTRIISYRTFHERQYPLQRDDKNMSSLLFLYKHFCVVLRFLAKSFLHIIRKQSDYLAEKECMWLVMHYLNQDFCKKNKK